MKFSIDASELNQIAVDLGKASDEVAEKVKTVVKRSALGLEAEAKAFAPVGETGDLQASIGIDIIDHGLGAVVGPTVEYGGFVEYGTSRMAPRAYLGPAFDRAVPGYVSALEQVARDIL